jgi:DNA-binding CsgD family transcriptional regulator
LSGVDWHGLVMNSEVRRMERRGDGTVERLEGGNRQRDAENLEFIAEDSRSGEVERLLSAEAHADLGTRGSIATRGVPPWLNWQSALYLFVVGLVCVLLVPLTSFWWLALVCATAAPVALAILDRPGPTLEKADVRKVKEREILQALAERGALTTTTAAMRTSLTVDEASKMLEGLARKGHLELRMDSGAMSYALQQRDTHELTGKIPASLERGGAGAPHLPGLSQKLDEPLSEREIEVLNVLASGRTNSEAARELFISVGTVKSHTNNIYRKLGATNRAGALARARSLDLLSG